MRQTFNRSNLVLAAAMALVLSNLPNADAGQQSKVIAETSMMECPDTAYEVAYETSPRFISWLLKHPELIAVIADAERRAALAKVEHASMRGNDTDTLDGAKWAELVGGGGE